jgi:1,4-alpha-glucan branching enzyme
MYQEFSSLPGGVKRLTPKKVAKPINFICIAPEAKRVSVIGEFNQWEANANPMRRQPDGGWHTQVTLGHGHHKYLFLVDGVTMLDPRASGTVSTPKGEKISIVAVS